MLLTRNSQMKLLIGILFFIIYYIIFGFSSMASGMIHNRITLALPVESGIPYLPAWSMVYLSISFLLFISLYIFIDWTLMAAFAITLLIETAIAGLFFIIIPIKLIYLPSDTSGDLSTIVYIAKFFSMNNNYFPSLHTAFAFTAAFAYGKYCSKLIKPIFYLWASAIALSTLFIHEHHIADLMAGYLLSLLACWYILPVIKRKLYLQSINQQNL